MNKSSALLASIFIFLLGLLAWQYWNYKNNPKEVVVEVVPTPTVVVVQNIKDRLVLVEQVVDGDTIKVKIDNKLVSIRLIGVDTPELLDRRKMVQCFAKEASVKTKELLQGKMVRLENDPTQGDKDVYQRPLRYIYLEDGTLINKKLIEEGFGFEYTYKLPYKYRDEFINAQLSASEQHRGLWAKESCNGKR